MNISATISNLQQAGQDTQVQYAIARKMLDQQESQGAAMVEMIKAAGQAGNPDTVAATGLGGNVDAIG